MEITLCLIVKDEEKNLPACLSSFEGVFEKLVVVDTGSTDKTVDVAKKFGADVFHFEWTKNFSEARNFALGKVQTEWTMMVDADDTLESKDRLLAELGKLSEETLGVFLPYLYSNVRKGQGNMAFLPRIWKTALRLTYGLPIHEYLNVPPEPLQKFVRVNVPLLHHKSEEGFSESFRRNVEILEHAYEKGDRHPRILFYLGHDHFYAGDIDESLKWFKKFLRLKTRHPHEAYKAWMMIAKIHLKKGDHVAMKKAYHQAIKICPDFLEPHILLGDLSLQEKKYEAAVQYYNEALHCKPPRTHIFLNMHLDYAYAERKLHEALKAIEPRTP